MGPGWGTGVGGCKDNGKDIYLSLNRRACSGIFGRLSHFSFTFHCRDQAN